MNCLNAKCEYYCDTYKYNCAKLSVMDATECDQHIFACEVDPNGISAHEPGAKLDDGKLLAGILQQFALAITEIMKVATFGARKYSRGGWQHVTNGRERYSDAMMRHYLKESLEPNDPDSGLSHEAHLAWNALARLELKLRGE